MFLESDNLNEPFLSLDGVVTEIYSVFPRLSPVVGFVGHEYLYFLAFVKAWSVYKAILSAEDRRIFVRN